MSLSDKQFSIDFKSLDLKVFRDYRYKSKDVREAVKKLKYYLDNSPYRDKNQIIKIIDEIFGEKLT